MAPGKKRGKGQKIIEKILEVLHAHAEITAHLMDVVTSDYASSYQKLRRGPRPFKTDWAEKYRETQRFHTFMNKLKREGFVAREKQRKGSLWKITKKGKEKWKMLQEKAQWRVPDYAREDDGVTRVIAFDVPERERRNRIWLQSALQSFGFKPIQKSVLIGTCRIPKLFLEDLREKRMLAYVHMFEAGKNGTLEEMER